VYHKKGVKKGSPSQEVRDKISTANKGKKRSEDFKKMNRYWLDRKLSDETKKKIGDANRGKKRSDDIRAKLSIIAKSKKRKLSPEAIIKLRAASRNRMIGFKFSEESKIKMRHSNLKRPATGASKYKGVRGFSPTSNIVNGIKIYSQWYASINLSGKTKYLGLFRNEKDAATAYNIAAKKYHGEFAILNKI